MNSPLSTWLTVVLGLSFFAFAQLEYLAAQPFQTDQEQIGEFVVSSFQDSQQRLWFGTMARGVACFDGKEVKYFSKEDGLAGDTVVSVANDREGNLWFGTHTGASKFDGSKFTNYRLAQGLSGAGCKILVTSQGSIWAATNDGAFRLQGDSFVKFRLPDPPTYDGSYKWELGKVWAIIEDSQGNIWFGRDGLGACRYDGKSFKHFTKEDGLCSNNVSQIVEDRQGNFWFGSLSSDYPKSKQEGGVSRLCGTTIRQFPEIRGLNDNDIYTIACERSGKVWIGALGLGVYRYDGKEFTLFDKTNRMDLTKGFGVQAILEAQDGRLWFGFSGGLFRLDGKSLINVPKRGPCARLECQDAFATDSKHCPRGFCP
ncbi:MAG: two-component regulator propeller domain-containing protein [Planctomycetota bacterium]